jgi:hypothetical protein
MRLENLLLNIVDRDRSWLVQEFHMAVSRQYAVNASPAVVLSFECIVLIVLILFGASTLLDRSREVEELRTIEKWTQGFRHLSPKGGSKSGLQSDLPLLYFGISGDEK